MRQGYTMLWMGWQWDVPAGRMRMAIPIATEGGQPITGLVRGNFIPGANATVAAIADRNHEAYPVVDPDSPAHVLYVRTLPTDPPQVVPRARWRFASPGTITIDGGFEAGRIYDVVYRARDPRVVGVGLAGTRDVVSFFKHATAAEGNPMPGLRLAIGWGVSQTGRFLRHFVYQGFNEDERGRIVFDGVFDQVGGAGRGSFNHRFGQQSRDQLQHFNIQYPVDMFPFTDERETDPVDRPRRRPARARRGARTPCRSWCTCSPTPSTSTAPARWSIPTSPAPATSPRPRPAASTWWRRRRTSSARSRPARSATRTSSGRRR